MSKNFFGGAIINSGPTLPLAADTPDGALFYKTGSASGLYYFGFNPDSNSGSYGDQSTQAWSVLVDTSGAAAFVSKTGDDMSGNLRFLTSGTGLQFISNTDNAKIYLRTNSPDSSDLVFELGDNGAAAPDSFVWRGDGSGGGGPTQDIMRLTTSGLTILGNTVWHSGNGGAGSGMNADLLDGQHGAYYLDLGNFSAGTLPVARGGTGTGAGPSAGSIIYGASNSAYSSNAVGVAGWLLASGGSGAPTWLNPATLTVNYAATAGTATNATSAGSAGTAGTANALASTRSFSITGAASTSVGVAFNGTADVVLNVSSLAAGSLTGTVPVAALPSIPNSSLANSGITFGSTAVALGSTVTSFTNLTSVSANNLTATTGVSTGTLSSTAGITTTTLSASQGISGQTLSSTNSLSVGTTATITGQLNANGGVVINNSAPVVSLQSTTSRSAFMHAGGDNFYVLRGDLNSGTWDSGPNGRHPLTLSLTSGDATFSGNVTAYSDRRLKEDIGLIDSPVQKVQALNGVTFTRKGSTTRGTGLIAQDVQKVLPEAVAVDEEGYLSVAYGNIVGLLVEAIKAQQDQIAAMQRRIDSLID
jgi:hypothetical protein